MESFPQMSLEQERGKLVSALQFLDINLTPQVLDHLLLYYSQLKQDNQKAGITSLEKSQDILVQLFADSLTLLPFLETRSDLRKILDIGTAGGFPGLPLKIALPEITIALLDTAKKKLGFCHKLTLALKLKNVAILEGRAETWAHHVEHREKYDLVCSKALSTLATFLEYGMPFLRVGGILAAFKGEDGQSEVDQAANALKILQGRVLEVRQVSLPGHHVPRTLVFVEKVGKIDNNYPRKPDLPRKRPL